MKLKLFTLFSGIGTPEFAFKDVFPDGEVVGYSEINKYANGIMEYHYPGVKNYGDATTIDVNGLPNFDILMAGFPCQSFSIAGKRGGFADTRGTLFFEIIRILQAKRPRYFILENVKGLLSHDRGRTFQIILKSLFDCGYGVQWQVLNTKWYLPQNRERIYVVGHLRETSRPEIFPVGEISGLLKYEAEADNRQPQTEYCATTLRNNPGKADAIFIAVNKSHGEFKETNIVNAIDSNYTKGFDNHGQRTGIIQKTGNICKTHPTSQGGQIYSENGISPALNAGSKGYAMGLIQTGVIGKDSEATRVYNPDGIARTIKNGGGMGAKTGLYCVAQRGRANGQTLEVQKEDCTNTLTGAAKDNFIVSRAHGFNKGGKKDTANVRESARDNELIDGIRRLTPVECERLQGFPDSWTEFGIIAGKEVKISDTQRYKALGNAMSVPVVKEIFLRLKNFLEKK